MTVPGCLIALFTAGAGAGAPAPTPTPTPPPPPPPTPPPPPPPAMSLSINSDYATVGQYHVNAQHVHLNFSANITNGTAPYFYTWTFPLGAAVPSDALIGGSATGATFSQTVPGITLQYYQQNSTYIQTISLQVTDSLGAVITTSVNVTLTWNETGSPLTPSYTWSPAAFSTGQVHSITIVNGRPNSTVQYTAAYSPSGDSTPLTTLGSTDSTGFFYMSFVADWGAVNNAVNYNLYVAGTLVAITTNYKI